MQQITLDDAESVALLEAARGTVGLGNFRIDTNMAPVTSEHLFALSISMERPGLADALPAGQRQLLGQEVGRAVLLGAMNRARQAHGLQQPPPPPHSLRLPVTSQPLPNAQNEALDWALAGDLQRIRPTVYLPLTVEVSLETTALLDSGERFNAFFAAGAVYRCAFDCTLLNADDPSVSIHAT